MRVSAPDLRQIVHFLDAALAEESAGPFPRSTFVALTDLIAADQADYFEVRSVRSVISFTTAFDEDPAPLTDEVVARTAHLNPLGPFKWGPAHGPLRMSEIVSERRLVGRSTPATSFDPQDAGTGYASGCGSPPVGGVRDVHPVQITASRRGTKQYWPCSNLASKHSASARA